jgi:hypothetical protein
MGGWPAWQQGTGCSKVCTNLTLSTNVQVCPNIQCKDIQDTKHSKVVVSADMSPAYSRSGTVSCWRPCSLARECTGRPAQKTHF